MATLDRRPRALLIRHPAAPTQWEREISARICTRVAAHSTGTDGLLLGLLILRAKVDGPPGKLAALLGLSDPGAELRAAMHRLTTDPDFNRLFHLIRSAL